MRRVLMCVLVVLAACDRGDRYGSGGSGNAGASLTSDAGGDVTLTDGSNLHLAITSERYKQWDIAQSALDQHTAARFGAILQPESPTQQTVEKAVAYLRGQPAARRAIEGSGMTVRDFVLMTVALERQMRLAETRGEAPSPEYLPMELPELLPEDSLYLADSAYAPMPISPMPPMAPLAPMPPTGTPMPYPVTGATAAPTMPPSMPLPTPRYTDTVTRGDSVMAAPPVRDTASMPRAGVWRDTVIRRDSVLPPPGNVLPRIPQALPRDTLPRQDTPAADSVGGKANAFLYHRLLPRARRSQDLAYGRCPLGCRRAASCLRKT